MSAPEAAAAPGAAVLCEVDAGVARLTLNRPQQFNALSEQVLAELDDALGRIAADAAVRVVVIAGAGKAFCAGHDLKQMRANPRLEYYQRLFADCARVMRRLQKLPQPVIARVHGVATAAGCQLVAMCDLAVAAQEARFAVSGINAGLFCSSPSVALARNIGRKQAFEMLVTGEFIDAHTALARGLVNQVVALADLDGAIARLADAIRAKPAPAVAMGKELFYRQIEMGIDAAYQLAGQTMACNMIDEVAQEGVSAFIEKRTPAWPAKARPG
jgi:enoyl-CoA hydratase/carnithine racemase